MAHYGIIGSGKCGENIIEDGLSEIGIENNVFLIYPRKGASDSEDRVYDYMLENEAEYIAYCKTNAPQILIDNASKVFDVTGEDAWVEILNTLKGKKGTLLVLWDSENEGNITDIVFKASDMGIPVKELSNGLAPINVEAPSETQEEEADVVEIEPFSEDELRSMSIGVLRKAATARGVANVGDFSKEELINQLIDRKTHVENVEDAEVKNNTTTSNGTTNVTVEYTLSQERASYQTPEGDCVVNVVFPNGTIVTTSATTEEVRNLLGLG